MCCCSRSWLSGGCRCPCALWCLDKPWGFPCECVRCPALQSASRKKVDGPLPPKVEPPRRPNLFHLAFIPRPRFPGLAPTQNLVPSRRILSSDHFPSSDSDHQLQVRRQVPPSSCLSSPSVPRVPKIQPALGVPARRSSLLYLGRQQEEPTLFSDDAFSSSARFSQISASILPSKYQ